MEFILMNTFLPIYKNERFETYINPWNQCSSLLRLVNITREDGDPTYLIKFISYLQQVAVL